MHVDGYIYSAGVEYIDEENLPSDILIMKLDTDGNLVWKKNIDKAEVEIINEIDSFNEHLLISGYSNYNTSTTFIARIDTSATIQVFANSVAFGISGSINVESKDDFICYSSMSAIELTNNETLYLAKFDEHLDTVWDTLVPNTSQFYLRARRMEMVNDQLVILSGIADAPDYTNNRVWSHAAAWSLDGEFQWDHVYFQDSAAIHHLDDVEMLPNGDLIFMGTVFDTAGQHLWLFRTDSQGCGTLQETCYYTLDQYFGLDTMVSVVETELSEIDLVKVLGNPFSEQLVVQSNSNQLLEIIIHNIQGKMVYEGVLNGGLSLNTANWQSGVYIMQIMNEDKLVGLKKLVRE